MDNRDIKNISVDVVMACYQEPIDWLCKAINSILDQTFTNFKFLIVLDDPNNNELIETLKRYQETDTRVEVLVNDDNLGLAKALNRGIQASAAPFIARMDADDISSPDRLETQLKFLYDHPEIGLVGSAIDNINEKEVSLGIKRYETDPILLKKMIPFCSIACHPTWMFTRASYTAVGGYRNLSTAQDYDFLYRLLDAQIGVANLNTPLLKYRIHTQSITSGMSLKRYKIRQYILKMHMDRINLGSDNFSELELETYINNAKHSPTITKLLTKLREAEEKGSATKLIYLSLLTLMSADVRRRVTDHIQLKLLLSRYKGAGTS